MSTAKLDTVLLKYNYGRSGGQGRGVTSHSYHPYSPTPPLNSPLDFVFRKSIEKGLKQLQHFVEIMMLKEC